MKLSTSGDVSMRVGVNVRLLRQLAGMTIAELSAATIAADGEPINASQVQRIETGARGITVDELEALARALGVDPVRLLEEPIQNNLDHIVDLLMKAKELDAEVNEHHRVAQRETAAANAARARLAAVQKETNAFAKANPERWNEAVAKANAKANELSKTIGHRADTIRRAARILD